MASSCYATSRKSFEAPMPNPLNFARSLSRSIRHSPLATAVGDISRLMYLRDYIQKLGALLTRKRVLLKVGVGATFVISTLNHFFKDSLGFDLPPKRVLFISGLITGTTYLFGKACQILPGLVNRRSRYSAEGNLLSSMEIYRQRHALAHLRHLYDRVYRFEADHRYHGDEQLQSAADIAANHRDLFEHFKTWQSTPEGRRVLHSLGADSDDELYRLVHWIDYANPHSGQLEKCESSFLISSMYAILHKEPQSRQLEQIGFDLSFYQHFLDGAPLHESDKVLSDVHMYNSIFVDIRRDLEHRGGSLGQRLKKWGRDLAEKTSAGGRHFVQRQWHQYTLGKLSVEAGIRLGRLNTAWPEYSFNAQDLLWPGAEDAQFFVDHPDARQALLDERNGLIRLIFGREWFHARRMIKYIALSDFIILTRLRIGYDPDYGADTGRLPYHALDDARDEELTLRQLRKLESRIAELSAARQIWEPELRACWPALFETDAAEKLRAVEIGFHTNRQNIRLHTERHGVDKVVQTMIEDLIAQRHVLCHRLVELRVVHELSRIRLAEYRGLVADLMGIPAEGKRIERNEGSEIR